MGCGVVPTERSGSTSKGHGGALQSNLGSWADMWDFLWEPSGDTVPRCDLMALLWGWSAERVVLGKDLVVPFQAQPVPLLCPIWAKQPPRPSPRETLREASPSAAPGAATQKTEDGGSSQRSRSNGVLFAQLLPRPVSGWRIHPGSLCVRRGIWQAREGHTRTAGLWWSHRHDSVTLADH